MRGFLVRDSDSVLLTSLPYRRIVDRQSGVNVTVQFYQLVKVVDAH